MRSRRGDKAGGGARVVVGVEARGLVGARSKSSSRSTSMSISGSKEQE